MTVEPTTQAQTQPQGPQLILVIDDIPSVMPCFAIVLYTRELLSRHGAAVLEAFDRFEALCGGRERLTLYNTETMSKRKPTTPGTFNLLKTWLKPGAPRREYVALDINGGGPSWAATSDLNFSVLGRERDAPTFDSPDANWIRMSVPLGEMRGNLAALEAEAMRLFGSLPFVSGHAGPTLELSPYYRPRSQRFAWTTVMRYRGFDFCDPFPDGAGVAGDGLRTVNWLTFLGKHVADDLGGAKAIGARLTPACSVSGLATGVAIKAGARPQLGDRHANDRLLDYESVFRACEPAIQRMIERRSPMMLLDDRAANTIRLLRRLAYEDA